MICLTDVYATIAEILDIELVDDMGGDSFSFRNSITGQNIQERPPVVHHSVNGTFSLRSKQWKMIFSDGSGGRQKPISTSFQKPYQLYDMEKDPSETSNVIESNIEIADRLQSHLEQIMNSKSTRSVEGFMQK